jgi:hypothetical protein
MANDQINPLVKLIQERLAWLFSEGGFRIVDYSCDRLGNCAAILESESLRLSFAQDRSFTQVHIASRADSSKSYDLGFLMLALTSRRPDVGFEGSAAVLKNNWGILTEALGPRLAETKQAYEQREHESNEILTRYQARIGVRRNHLVYRMRRTAVGRLSLVLLRYAGIGLVLWALYVVSHRGPP